MGRFFDKHAVIMGLSLLALVQGAVTYQAFTQLEPGEPYGAEAGQIAANLAEGRGYSSPLEPGSEPTAWVAPVVPLLWSAIFSIAGVYSRESLALILGLNLALSLLTALLFAGIVTKLCRWSSDNAPPPRYVWGVVVLACLWPTGMLLRVGEVWYFAVEDFFMAAIFWCVLNWMRNPSYRRALTTGCVVGCCVNVNVVLAPFYAVALLAGLIRCRGAARRTWLFQAMASGCVVVLLMVPWMTRNVRVFEKVIPGRSNFPVELRQGNNPSGAIVQTSSALHPALRRDELALYRSMGEMAYVDHAMKEAVDFIRGHPGLTIQRTAIRACVFWTGDVTGRWPWHGSQSTAPGLTVRRVIKAALNLLPLCILLWMLLRWRPAIPYGSLFFMMVVAVPLPYYLTHVASVYAGGIRSFVVLWAGVCLLIHHHARQRLTQNSV